MYDDVVLRLASLGYTVIDSDEWALQFVIDKVVSGIKNECHIDAVPDGLYQIAVDMACGEFLLAKKGSGQLDGLDVEAAVKTIKEGDTSVTYAIADNSITLDGLIGGLINGGRSQLVAYRRLAW